MPHRESAFLDTDVSLANLLAKDRALETSEFQATRIENMSLQLGSPKKLPTRFPSVENLNQQASEISENATPLPNKNQTIVDTVEDNGLTKTTHALPNEKYVQSMVMLPNHFAAVCGSKPNQQAAPTIPVTDWLMIAHRPEELSWAIWVGLELGRGHESH